MCACVAVLCRLLQQVNRAKRDAYFEKVRVKRSAWLAKLNEDAASWIGEDEIESVRRRGTGGAVAASSRCARACLTS